MAKEVKETPPDLQALRALFDAVRAGTLDPAESLVQSPGHPLDGQGAPLQLRCTGLISILGTIDVSGQSSPTLARPTGVADPAFAQYLGQGADGGPQGSTSFQDDWTNATNT